MSVRPFRGHFHPLVPLARTFQRAGHRVAVASAEDLASTITGAGLPWIPAGLHPYNIEEVYPRSDADYGVTVVRAKVEDLLEFSMGQFRPDVIIREPTDLAPIIAAEIVGAVNVIYGIARFIPASSWEYLEADQTITRLRSEYRLPEDPGLECMYRDLYLAVLPPFLEVHTPLPVPAVQQIRYVPWDGEVGEWPVEKGAHGHGRPTVLVTLGTVYNDQMELFDTFLAALGDEDLDVICTLGEVSDRERFASAPSNVQFEWYRPHSTILPRCQVTLCHGGFNTVMGSLLAGVPVVCVPLGSDHDYNARRCAAKGYGVMIEEDQATPERIREAVRTVLDDPTYAANVEKFQRRMERRPGLGAAVRRIERLVQAKGQAKGRAQHLSSAP
jgi:UDP:flavonoid glycosyltransferase YjiC (YdhE family)